MVSARGDPLAGRTTAVADGPAGGGVVAHDARNSAQAASFNPLFMLHPPEKAGCHRRNRRKRIAGRGCASLAQCRKRRMEPALESPLRPARGGVGIACADRHLQFVMQRAATP